MASPRHRRIAIAIVFLTLGVTAAFLAQGTTSLLSIFLLPLDTDGLAVAAVRPSATPTTRESVDPTPILQRNIFDSETGDLTQVPEPENTEAEGEEEEEVEWDPSQPLPACEGSLRLVGSLVNVRDRDSSFAAVTLPSGSVRLRRRGMDVEGREILAINAKDIVLRQSSGGPCQLAMFDPETEEQPARVTRTTPTPRRERPERPSRPGAISNDEMEEGISRVSDSSFTVQRSLVDSLLDNQAELMRTARIIPHQENGRTVGVKLYGIRRNSILGRLGMQNGDMLRTINGYDMTAPDSALEAYARLRNAQNLTVSIVRRGSPQTLEYTIE